MRPERIVMEGFGTFRERTEVDFDGVELFALTGNTGAGKSTIIDAMVFALYGAIPRLEDRGAVAPAISQDKVEAKVQLDFSVGGERYTAVRVVREVVTKAKKTTAEGLRTATTKEARLERRVDGDPEVIAGTADELTAEVERLLGLTFEHFTTCVVLPQGQFARFLHHKPRHRQDLLVELLDLGVYAEMASLARVRQKAAQQQLTFLGNELEGLGFATAEALVEQRARVATLEALLQTIDDVQPRLDENAKLIDAGRQQLAEAKDCVQRLAVVKQPKGVDKLAGASIDAAAVLDRATKQLVEATTAVDKAESARDELGDRSTFELARRDHAEVAGLRERVTNGRATVAKTERTLDAARRAADETRATHDKAVAALDAARLANRAADLADHLVSGEPCPVCGNQVHEVPTHDAPALKKAEKAEQKARANVESANEKVADASSKHERGVTLLAELETAVDALEQRLAEAGPVDDLTGRLEAIDRADAALKAAKATERQARRAVADAETEKQQADARAADAWTAFDAARDRVALLEPPATNRSDLLAAWKPLVEWAAEEMTRFRSEQATIEAEISSFEQQQASMLGTIAEACATAGVEPKRRPARDVTVEALADAKADVDSVVAAIDRRGALDEQIAAQNVVEAVSGRLARELSANGFEKWVLDEALQRLVDAATAILFELSGGAYSLLLDAKSGNFSVRDHKNAEALRSARTLSGGETFLASLALALSLADQVAEMAAGGAVRLESIFLDEGFGTLDPDTLDTVATAIEELGSRGRMVGLVSHVRELADRMPVRYVVEKGPSTSTVSRVEL